MVSSVRNLLCLTILAVLASTGYAIHCYSCSTLDNPKACKKNATTLTDCSTVEPPVHLSKLFKVGNATGCMKRKVKNPTLKQTGTQYDCYFGDVSNKQGCEMSDEVKKLNFIKISCNICTEDKCNGSDSLAPIAGAIILFFSVAHLLT
ncbi:uncharacterized protein LOC133850164 [Drosophila sulfurigaster albostrigata]|uniref:uncharacterized protein LOC133850164 n=1 Tax=Drosophila sulfurigaster albostrigata TaxID=89887 RepID=UPI002D21AD7B|nr:uncharacterized protein LOC133850164 [Drosophila sulfurigaster albostrigata]